MLNIGCHLSAEKGYMNMGKEAKSIDANTFQFFTRNPRGGKAKAIDEQDVKNFLEFMKENNFSQILAHAPYTLNACSNKEETREFALNTMADDLRRMEYTPNQLYNFHPGSHVGQGVEIGIDFIVKQLNTVLTPDMTTTVLLETMAGKGTEIGRSFEELKEILDGVKLDNKMGVCMDTCHIYDGGYDIVNDLVMENLPADLSAERRQVVLTAYQLLGKVHYFWGGKSLIIGWDSRWGMPMEVTAEGSSTTGTVRPFGLDCSGMVDWVFYNQSGGQYVIGHGGGATAQHSYCTPIAWSDAQPGDLVFYPGDSHVGIVCGFDSNGNIMVIHCASSENNVVVTGKSGFTSIGRPEYFAD